MKHFGEDDYMTTITDEFMRQMMSTTKNYCVVILKAGPNRNEDYVGGSNPAACIKGAFVIPVVV